MTVYDNVQVEKTKTGYQLCFRGILEEDVEDKITDIIKCDLCGIFENLYASHRLSFTYFYVLKLHEGSSVSFSPSSLRMLWTTGHGGRYNLQPTDNSIFHPPCALWLAEVVPILCTPQQEGPGQCLDCCRK